MAAIRRPSAFAAARPMTVLETDRLRLRRLTADDADFIRELLNDASFMRYIGDKGVRTNEDAVAYITTGPIASYEELGFGLYLVELKDGGQPIGICGLLKRPWLPHADLGFAFLPRFWSRGYAFESAAAVVAYGRDTVGLARIAAITSPDNVASMALLRKLGFAFDRTSRWPDESAEIRVFALETTPSGVGRR